VRNKELLFGGKAGCISNYAVTAMWLRISGRLSVLCLHIVSFCQHSFLWICVWLSSLTEKCKSGEENILQEMEKRQLDLNLEEVDIILSLTSSMTLS
jgi:hypothetical protein